MLTDVRARYWPRRRPYGPKPWNHPDALRSDVRSDDIWDAVRNKEPPRGYGKDTAGPGSAAVPCTVLATH